MKEIKLTIEGKTTEETLLKVLEEVVHSINISGLTNDEYVYENLVINLEVTESK